MIQKLIEKLNKKRLKERISSAIVMVALIVSISGVVGAVSGIVVSNRYNYALKNYGFSQGVLMRAMKHSRWHRIRWHRSMRRFIRIW